MKIKNFKTTFSFRPKAAFLLKKTKIKQRNIAANKNPSQPLPNRPKTRYLQQRNAKVKLNNQ